MTKQFDASGLKIMAIDADQYKELLELNIRCVLSNASDQGKTYDIYNARQGRCQCCKHELLGVPAELNRRYSSFFQS